MNRTEHELELMRLYLEGVASLEETQELESLIVMDASVRQDFLRYTHLDSALAGVRRSQPSMRPARRSVWLSWRPLTAAAAGIVFGMFCTSVVFGFVAQGHGVKKTPLAMVQPSFEDAQMPLAKGFPPAPALWTGDVAKVVPAENGIAPKDGHHMLKLETTVDGKPVLFPRLYQVIALPPSGNELREIEVSAAFASADSGSSPHYSIRAYAIAQEAEQLGPDWFSHRNEAIASAATGFDCPPVTSGWQSFGLRIQVPSKARSLVVFFGVKNQAKSPAKLPHYLDAVHVSLVDSPRIP
jgi:hypothetical protein